MINPVTDLKLSFLTKQINIQTEEQLRRIRNNTLKKYSNSIGFGDGGKPGRHQIELGLDV